MRLLTVSSLSSWIHCPRTFYLSYVLEIKEPPNSAMALGLVKHKLHELISLEEEPLVVSLRATDNVEDVLSSRFIALLQTSVMKHMYVLKSVGVPLNTAFQSALPLARTEALERARIIAPRIKEGILGTALWDSLIPKLKSEYSLESKKLGLKGRIDKLECYPDRIVPIELKSGMTPPDGVYDSHKIQAASYAMMLEEVFGTPVNEAVVHYVDSHQKRTIVMNPFLKEWVAETAAKGRACIETKELPKGCGKENCSACKKCEDSEFIAKRLSIIPTK